MPKYQYTAKDAAGKKKKGQLMAADEAALYELLRGENLFLISCRLAQTCDAGRYFDRSQSRIRKSFRVAEPGETVGQVD